MKDLLKFDGRMSQKSVKDILVVLRMVLKFMVRSENMERRYIDVRFQTERERKEVAALNVRSQQKILRHL